MNKKREINAHRRLYLKVSYNCSKLVTTQYSTSFSLGIRSLHKNIHFPVYAIYGFVRLADEIVDTFQEFDKFNLLDNFIGDTFMAIDEKISTNPILHAFQAVVNDYEIDTDLIRAFFNSMKMDLQAVDFDEKLYQEYIYGSAEVVGLMCLKVFVRDIELYEKLKPSASKLGSAFQKINFLRDLKSDYEERGRSYFSGLTPDTFNNRDKERIVEDIRKDLELAMKGIKSLPANSRKGVYLAQVYFSSLLNKLSKTEAKHIMKQRIRISNLQKLMLLSVAYLFPRYSYHILNRK